MIYKCPEAHEKMFNIPTSKVRDQNSGYPGEGWTGTRRAEAVAGMLDNILSVWVCCHTGVFIWFMKIHQALHITITFS